MATHSSLNSFHTVSPRMAISVSEVAMDTLGESLLWSLISPFQVQPQAFENSGR
jgi:hypothetical protein